MSVIMKIDNDKYTLVIAFFCMEIENVNKPFHYRWSTPFNKIGLKISYTISDEDDYYENRLILSW